MIESWAPSQGFMSGLFLFVEGWSVDDPKRKLDFACLIRLLRLIANCSSLFPLHLPGPVVVVPVIGVIDGSDLR